MSKQGTLVRSGYTRRIGRGFRLATVLMLVLSCARGDGTTLLAPVANPLDLAVVQVTPEAVTLPGGGSYQFTARAILPDSVAVVADVIWTATGGTITASGMFTAGATPGNYQISAQLSGRRRTGSTPVKVTPSLTSLSLTPATAALAAGATQQFSVAGTWSDGSSATPVVTWVATGGSITASGLYTGGTTSGSFRVIATQLGGSRADTSLVTVTAPPPMVNSLNTIADDMTLSGEGLPHGVPLSYGWSVHPRINLGNDPGLFQAAIAWGVLYEAAEGNPATNTRVEIRDIRMYILSKSDQHWHLFQSSTGVDGAAFVEDFSGNASQPAIVRAEPDGGTSATAGGGYNYHFWTPSGKATINPQDIAGVFTTVQARLVVNNPQQPDDRATARYVLCMGGDYWRSLTATADGTTNNDDIGIGRFKYVHTEWRAFNMTTLTLSQLQQNPPPQE